MIAALLLALREGVEAALIVGIILVYLDRSGRRALARDVWLGVAAAGVASLAGAVLLERLRISQEGFEGLMMLLAAVFVVTTVLWMRRVARHLKARLEERVDVYASRETGLARLGLAGFVFLVVAREGVELVLLLRAVELSSEGLGTWIGASLGLGLAIAVGVLFFRGTLRIPLARFFSATSVILMIIALQLALTGVHEMSEGMWIPSSRGEMALLGPIVRNDVFFFVAILGVAAWLALREWLGTRGSSTPLDPMHTAAERRRLTHERRRERRWLLAVAGACVAVVLMLAADVIDSRAAPPRAEAEPLTARDGQLRIPTATLDDGRLHFYTAEAAGTWLRFLAIRKRAGSYAVALDACLICGASGYHQEGGNVICRTCSAAIYIPSIGETGGCNPIGIRSRLEGHDVIVDLQDLAEAASPTAHRK